MTKKSLTSIIKTVTLASTLALSLTGCPVLNRRTDNTNTQQYDLQQDPYRDWPYQMTGPGHNVPKFRRRPDYALPGY